MTRQWETFKGKGKWSLRKIKSHCPKGHVMSSDNTYIRPSNGARICRTCKSAAEMGSRERKIQEQEAKQS